MSNEIIKVFESRSLPIIVKEERIFIRASDLAAFLGYKDPRVAATKIIQRHPEHFEGYVTVTKMVTLDGKEREVQVLNERGIYMFLMLSKQPDAIKFKRKVTEFLEEYRHQLIRQKELQLTFLEGEKEQLLLETQILAFEKQELASQVPLSPGQLEVIEDEIKKASRVIYGSMDPWVRRGKTMDHVRNAVADSLCRRFGVEHYVQLTRDKFYAAVSYLQRIKRERRVLA